ncbi:MAG TPA: alpha/beta hydrolase [Streptosporangiaceae bacterium]|nr:alpha/beta hydrolase [Streptosporangiaceae bacterium]
MAGPQGDRAWLDREYSPSSRVADMHAYLREYAARSAGARATLDWTDHAYGPGPAERLLFFPAARPRAPLLGYVHGGYWQELSKEESCFAAPDFVGRGAAFAAIGYGLAPAHRLDEIVAMVRRGVRWLYDNAAALGVDPGRIFLSGSSAGAHLVAMCLLDGWLPAPLRSLDVVRGAVLLSGVYELEPLRRTYVGEAIGLTAAEADRNSPIRRLRGPLPSVIVARGDNETTAFADQHDRFVQALKTAGAPVTDLVVAPRNHFDLPFDLGEPASPLGRATLARVGLR